MNRELKFRIFDKENKKMYLQESITKIDIVAKGVGVIDYADLPTGLKMPTEKIKSFENIEIMQYTGTNDCNREQIFEGDIVKYDSETYGKIVYEDQMYLIYFGGDEYDYLRDLDIYVEVVGNIYENKDFLEKITD